VGSALGLYLLRPRKTLVIANRMRINQKGREVEPGCGEPAAGPSPPSPDIGPERGGTFRPHALLLIKPGGTVEEVGQGAAREGDAVGGRATDLAVTEPALRLIIDRAARD
jgi:hypothetical protein